ncbi:MAG: hypothetical protein LBK65_00890 [Tannerellaceae bacterium]|jgi:hypothetical protein|nr:hypothetical protein [Tannerellaceae bacterium]
MNDEYFDRLLDEALNIPVPEGLAGRLEAQIDRYAAAARRRRIRLVAGVAASIILAAGIFINTDKQPSGPADTFSDPVEAAAAAERMLTFMSAQLNEGLHQVSEAGEKFEEANHTIDKYFNKYQP